MNLCVASSGLFLPSLELPASAVNKCWGNIETEYIYVKGHQVINLSQAIITHLSQSDFVLWISRKTYSSRDPWKLTAGVREVILNANPLVRSHWEDQTTQFWGGNRTGDLLQSPPPFTKVWLWGLGSQTMSSVPALGTVNLLVLASSFVPKGSHMFSNEREWNVEE